MRVIQHTVCVAGIACLAVGLAACGGGAGGGEESTSASPTTTTATTSDTSTATSGGLSATSTSAGAWTFTKDADGKSVASVKEKTGRNDATLDFTNDPNLLGRNVQLTLADGSRTSCALGFETRLSIDGGTPATLNTSNVDGKSDVVFTEDKELWQQISGANTVTLEVPTGPDCRASSAPRTTYEFDVTGAQDLPMDAAWTR